MFGDGSDAIHLFERDCSLQRRHQKVIEEAPAPGMTQDVRAAMGQAPFRRPKRLGIRGQGRLNSSWMDQLACARMGFGSWK